MVFNATIAVRQMACFKQCSVFSPYLHDAKSIAGRTRRDYFCKPKFFHRRNLACAARFLSDLVERFESDNIKKQFDNVRFKSAD